uniref:Uncharacterized protein n=1 Tax=Rhipicephalus microplus TaxID=6941 RepID=A0A6G5A2G7_RHIMP
MSLPLNPMLRPALNSSRLRSLSFCSLSCFSRILAFFHARKISKVIRGRLPPSLALSVSMRSSIVNVSSALASSMFSYSSSTQIQGARHGGSGTSVHHSDIPRTTRTCSAPEHPKSACK